ncbi:MAG: hypothetical protein A2V83_11010 [Nitrospirae bacterium RBG_16_64_22]|nr:MAG: hypothetical protein A2V83_11010 [Nitrospirae bacterium RBG_16_64_22]
MVWKILLVVLGLVSIVVPRISTAEEPVRAGEVVVTASRIEEPAEAAASSITVITRKEIEQKQYRTVFDALRDVAGLDAVRSGGPGSLSSVFLRGTKSEHTLVLIDGVEVNDPVSAGRSFNFANLSLANVERIEVLRGPQSTLYGSDSMGGVINVITRKGKGPLSGDVSVEAGSFNTFRERLGLSGGTGKAHYAFGFDRLDSAGISAAGEKYGNTEKDGVRNTSYSGRAGYKLSDRADAEIVLRGHEARTEIDAKSGAGGDDPNRVATSRMFSALVRGNLAVRDWWNQALSIGRVESRSTDHDDFDSVRPSNWLDSRFEGRMTKADWQNTLLLGQAHTVVGGVEWEQEGANSEYRSLSSFGSYNTRFDDRTARTWGIYAQERWTPSQALQVTAGLRRDDHDRFGGATSGKVAGSVLVPGAGMRLRASWGTGFKAPSLYQLYSQYGSETLQPEKSASYEVGLRQPLAGPAGWVDLAYFRSRFRNLIDYDFGTSKYVNTGRAKTSGFELEAGYKPASFLSLLVRGTVLDATDEATGERLIRRARNRGSLAASWLASPDISATASLVRVGKREDTDFSTYPSTRVRLPAYTLVNLSGEWRATKSISLFARVENVFDKEYEDVLGYGTPGRSFYAGVHGRF